MDIILGLIWVGTSHIRIGLDTAYYSESGWDTAHNITCYSESGGDTAQENVFRYSHWGGDTAHNTTYYLESGGGGHRTSKCVQMFTPGWGHRTEFRDRGRDTAQNQSRLLVGWLAGWEKSDYSVNPGSILEAETCKILS